MKMDTESIPPDRRPLKTRRQTWVPKLAHALDRAGFTPNGISLAGVGISLLGSAGLAATRHIDSVPMTCGLFVFAAVTVQLRLLANMMDGLVAVECGRASPDGDFFNEVPDRVEDSLFLCAAGYAANATEAGLVAALLAVSVAYLRAYRASRGLGQDFCGPGAKPQRMFVLTVGLLVAGGAIGTGFGAEPAAKILGGTLALIIALSAITLLRRTARILRAMRAVV